MAEEKSESCVVKHSVLPPKRSLKTTIELPIFVGLVGNVFLSAVLKNIILYRTCVHSLNNTVAECESFLSPVRTDETNVLENEVQEYAAYVLTALTMMDYIGPTLMSMFIGVWSNTYGRKPLLVWPFLGLALTSVLAAGFAMYNDLGPWWCVVVSIPACLTGGNIVLLIGAYCYIIDTSTPENTALRMTIIEATTSLSTIVGSFLSSYLVLAMGNVNVLLFAAGLKLVAYAFTHIFIMESLLTALKGGFTKVFNFAYVKDVLTESFKKKPNNRRAQIILICILKFIQVVSTTGITVLEYLYSRQKLQWALQDYTFYTAASTAITFIGGFLGILVVQRLLKLNDVPFTIITLVTLIGEYVIKMFATSTWHMYLAATVSMFKSLFGPLMRTHLRKIVPVEDIVKVFALMCTLQCVSPVVSPVIYNSIYSKTLATFPGSIYLLSSILTVVCIIFLGFVHHFSKSRITMEKQ